MTIDLPFSLQAPGLARAFLRTGMCPEHTGLVLEEAVLLTSETVTNAVEHGAPPIRLVVECREDVVAVSVSDTSPSWPEQRCADELDEGGRGLALVDVLSSRWGTQDLLPASKAVWFELDL